MKSPTSNIVLGSLLLTIIFSCNKTETGGANHQATAEYTATSEISDSISSAATLQVKDKQFIKSADVNMEVKDVYDATISIEKQLKDLRGFVTSSRLNSQIISEETFNTSDESATLVRKFQTENSIQVRVPTEKLGEFLTFINAKKLFLNTRNITAEDVTANIKLANLETKRNAKTEANISQLKTHKDKVNMADENQSEANYQKVADFEMTDQLKYSTVDIYLKEPKLRIAEIAITNTRNIDNKYKFNFFYDVKNAFVEGFYIIQKLIIGLVTIWPILLIGAVIFYIIKKRKPLFENSESENISK
ncbi:DUF4349 domain-containing protein [Kaistella flava (ex Peng et al. 2021)]|uniref:DUF4349 domain-containing protein n=1 Tax=Kaistella flava (ex Peng et al. 2021) TaxID=2038776 RepID=A0A7M2YCB7_9FLAO|nr:DUF4349 domain-containing protein [Kaistella flava (ex Peng et al. 2021)]QOW11274.1 DUF4349 domain-containing protein [Kaistella flava (ex Peng et al. 2021)]